MNIGFLIYSLEGGGAERTVSVLANRFDEMGYSVSIYVLKEAAPAYEINAGISVKVCEGGKQTKKVFKFLNKVRNLSRFLEQDQVCLLFAFTIAMVPFALAGRLGKRIRVIGSERANPRTHTGKYQWII